jgi:hypothetical protein
MDFKTAVNSAIIAKHIEVENAHDIIQLMGIAADISPAPE